MSSENETLEGIEQAEGKESDQGGSSNSAAGEAGTSGASPSEAESETGAEAGGEASAAATDPVEAIKAELEETKQNWARERADFSNYRKRMMEEVGRARQSGMVNFVKGIIPVIDNLNLVLAAPTEDPAVKNFVIGVDMIRTEFMGILNREGIQSSVVVDEPFDPRLMEAVELEEREGVEGDRVLHVYKQAYVYQSETGERQVLRPATVKVVRGKKAQSPEGGEAQA